MKFEFTKTYNLANAILDARNPKESWVRSDSDIEKNILGPKDLELAQKLIKAGNEHRKFMRQIFVVVDITAPLYWWKEFDTYKIGTTANSTSTMHKLASKPITIDCFEMDDAENIVIKNDKNNYITDSPMKVVWKILIDDLERLRQIYNETKDKRYWKELIRLLPESWLQTRSVSMNYENIYSMIRQRKNHKLSEWSESFIDWCHSLPYAEELLFLGVGEA